MIEINSPIEDLRYDPITKKYRVVDSTNFASTTNKNSSKSFSAKNNSNKSSVTFKIKPQNLQSNRNRIEKKGLHVDFLVS